VASTPKIPAARIAIGEVAALRCATPNEEQSRDGEADGDSDDGIGETKLIAR
jgi:hypothetical protein